MKHKAHKIYNMADEYIQEMVRFDMVGVIAQHNKRFYNIFYKSLPVILKQTMTLEMIKDLIKIAEQRIKQSIQCEKKSQFLPSVYDRNESLVRKYYLEFIEKLEELQ